MYLLQYYFGSIVFSDKISNESLISFWLNLRREAKAECGLKQKDGDLCIFKSLSAAGACYGNVWTVILILQATVSLSVK